jgi:hypothetical protein
MGCNLPCDSDMQKKPLAKGGVHVCPDIRTQPIWGGEMPQNRPKSRGFRDPNCPENPLGNAR